MGWSEDQRKLMARQNAESAARRSAAQEAARQASHKSFIAAQEKIGERLRESYRNDTESRSREHSHYMQSGRTASKGNGATGKSSSSGALVVLVAIGFFIYASQDHRERGHDKPAVAAESSNSIVSSTRHRDTDSLPQAAIPPQADGQRLNNDLAHQGTLQQSTTPQAQADKNLRPPPSFPADVSPTPVLRYFSRVDPTYPAAAIEAGITGLVKVFVTVAPNGVVTKVEVKEGHPMLAAAAVTAAWQWRFLPFSLRPGDSYPVAQIDFPFGPQ